MLWRAVFGAGLGLAVLWLALVVVLRVLSPDEANVRQLLRLLPDILRLVGRLARDRSLAVGVRTRLWLLLAYSPSRSTRCRTSSR